MKNLFNSVALKRPMNNVFDLSHDVKLSCNMGDLVPMCILECVPGDKFNLSCESLLRFAPLVAPMMHRVDVTMHYFFVPNRILWYNWEAFITGDGNPPGTLPAFPYIDFGTAHHSKLGYYLGLPDAPGSGSEKVSALPFAAYQVIWHEYYRDQNLISQLYTPGHPDELLTDGNNTGFYDNILGKLRKRAWEHDYFTACLPWAQKGNAVEIPLGDVVLKSDTTGMSPDFKRADNHAIADTGGLNNTGGVGGIQAGGFTNPLVYDPEGTLQSSPTTINDLRRAFRLQEWFERQARGGTRYIEHILGHFGVRSSDKRLQRPEYIVGVKSPVVISEVLNTTGTTGQRPQGDMAGHGVGVTSGQYGKYFCEEHGYIIGVMSVMPKTAYQDGVPRHWLKTNDQYDYYYPEFANIGEQPVFNKEVYAYQAGGAGDNTFGYVPRYAEYKYQPSRVAGDFRTTLDFWHMGRKFNSAPALNQAFVECDPTFRVFAVTDSAVDHCWVHVLNKIRAVRPMPKFGVPQF